MILILDFGSQYTQLIARRIRERSVYAEIHPCNLPAAQLREMNPDGVILSGGPSSVEVEAPFHCGGELFSMGIPILGICYGHQLIAHRLGGAVTSAEHSEYGRASLSVAQESELFRGVSRETDVWMSHVDQVCETPEGFRTIASTRDCPVCAMENPAKKIYGIQFHPEVAHTPEGRQILENFTLSICRSETNWNMGNFLKEKITELSETAGNRKVLCAMSGGVDSGVTAVLLHRALGERVVPVFVDNGLLRKNEKEAVVKEFKANLGIPLRVIEAGESFLNALRGVGDAEKKRKIIGAEFIRVFEEFAATEPDIAFLAQGTLYPDVIESVSVKGPSAVIKSHHNVGGLPEKMNLKIIEPLRELFKDEVRELGLELGLSPQTVNRQPFPGPGLAVRIPGAVCGEKLGILREADSIIIEEMKTSGLYREVWQSFAVLLPVKSVGVMGDFRTHEWALSFRCVDSQDAMTANWSRLPHDLLDKISSRIVNEVKGVNRVLFDITSKPPGTIEWE